MKRWAQVIALTLPLGLLPLPASWIFAGILASGIVALCTGTTLIIPRWCTHAAVGVIAVIAAIPFSLIPLQQLQTYLLPGLFVAVVSIGISLVCARALRSSLGAPTALLSTLPGGASVFSALAADMGAHPSYVALTQYLRVLLISLSLPLITLLIGPSTQSVADVAPATFSGLGLLVVIVALGQPLARLLRIPSPSFFGPFLITLAALMRIDAAQLSPPPLVLGAALVVIGWMCGGGLSLPTLKLFAHQLPPTLGIIALLMGSAALIAWPIAEITNTSYFEAYLATSPGALESVLAIAAETHADPIVVTIQLIRLMAVLAIPLFMKRRD
ncbi:AbrB family transcriptional regulator [Corynebacterium felinum]|uniref:Membrane AbrB-like protein n=1 Tax=Corynebacterium felinum TaxID=131318 RepID=A0ABU2B6U9_9CORY|nr:AbrB family transcriptional regulator [Corynebacterium felinum]MDF5819787.1 AbrB family transcriptional regulator [Corynebacterium felinum]MDR7354342.1 membrane AbrB-like protein [Corynebacterium felinum]WJY93716.1 Putative ammonia monooxygenase [Corynebacterium felinum]